MTLTSRLPLPALQIFEAAGRTGSFARAAVELSLTPSAVSHAIRKLEAQLGLQLFVRHTREVALTPPGDALLRHVQRGLAELQQGLALASAAEPAPLRLHTAPSFATQWLIPRLPGFVREHPDIDLRFSASTDYAQFDNDDFDLDIVYGPLSGGGEDSLPLLIEEVTPMCSPALAASLTSIQQLYELPLIQSSGKSVTWADWFQANGLRSPRSFNLGFDRSSMAIVAAVDGLGVVLESNLLTERERQSGQLVAPLQAMTLPIRYVGHHLVHPRRPRDPDALLQFKRWLLGQLAQTELAMGS